MAWLRRSRKTIRLPTPVSGSRSACSATVASRLRFSLITNSWRPAKARSSTIPITGIGPDFSSSGDSVNTARLANITGTNGSHTDVNETG